MKLPGWPCFYSGSNLISTMDPEKKELKRVNTIIDYDTLIHSEFYSLSSVDKLSDLCESLSDEQTSGFLNLYQFKFYPNFLDPTGPFLSD